MRGRCGTHNSGMNHQLMLESVLKRLGDALRKRGKSQMSEIIYPSVMEVVKEIDDNHHVAQFEDTRLQEAIMQLYQHGWSEAIGRSYNEGRAVADAYKAEVEARAKGLSRLWLDNTVAAQKQHSDWTLTQIILHGLFQALGDEEPPADLRATNKVVRLAMHNPRVDKATSELWQAAVDDTALRDLAFRIVCQVRGAEWALGYANYVYSNGDRGSTADRRSWCGKNVQSDSTSYFLLAAFAARAATPAVELARKWIEGWYPASEMVSPHSSTLKISFIGLQVALGLTSDNGIDCCHDDLISCGLYQVLLTERAAQLVAALPGAAQTAVMPPTHFIMTNPKDLGPQLADLLTGVIWGLAAVPTWYSIE